MRSLKLLLGIVTSGVSVAALACEYPSLPTIPDDQRIRGRIERQVRDDMRRYVTEMSVYIACIQSEYRAITDAGATVTRALLETRHSEAVAEMQAVGDVYEQRVGPVDEILLGMPVVTAWDRVRATRRLQELRRTTEDAGDSP